MLLFWQYLDDHEFDIFGIGILFRDKKRQVLFDYLCSEVVIYDVRYLFNGEQNGTLEVFDGMNVIKFYHFVIELWVILRQILSVSREIREYWLFGVNWFR